MRKRTIRNGMRLIFMALVLIIAVSFFHEVLADWMSLSLAGESRLYRYGIFWAAVVGGYGVVLSVFGFVLPAGRTDYHVRLMPVFFLVAAAVSLFFYLLAASFDDGAVPRTKPRPGETITI